MVGGKTTLHLKFNRIFDSPLQLNNLIDEMKLSQWLNNERSKLSKVATL